MMKTFLGFLVLSAVLTACLSPPTPLATCSPATTAETAMVEPCLLTGYSVENSQGERLGSVENIFVDPEQGQVAYIALAFDDPGVHSKAVMIVPKEKFALIPWDILTSVPGEDRLILDSDLDALAAAPHFDRLPSSVNPELADELHDYWIKKDYRR